MAVGSGGAAPGSSAPGPPPPPLPPPPPPSLGGPWVSGTPPAVETKEFDRTLLGLLLAIIGFLLVWIPDVDIVGGLLVLVGAFLIFLGRRGFGERHRRSVAAGVALILIGLVGTFLAAVIYALSIVAAAVMPGVTIAQIGSQISGDLTFFVAATATLGILTVVGEILLVYQLADPRARQILWAGLAAQIAAAAGVIVIVLPAVSSAISQATSTGTLNLAPINALETKAQLVELVGAIPALLFAWGYYRTRRAISRRDEPGAPSPLGPA